MACNCSGNNRPLRVIRADNQPRPEIRQRQTRQVIVHTKPADNRPMHNYRVSPVSAN